MKMDFFGSRSKKQKPEAAKPAQGMPQKKEIKVDESRRPRVVQPVVTYNRQPAPDKSKAQPAVPPSRPAAGARQETAPQETTIMAVKENVPASEVKPAAETPKATIEAVPSQPASAPAVPAKAPADQKGAAGEFSDLFARNSAEVTENSRLAEGMTEIDAKDLLTEGLGLVARFKRTAK